jgi:hypothetical protein
MQHRIVNGRILRILTVEAADVHCARRHISAQRPISAAEQRAIRRRVEVRS